MKQIVFADVDGTLLNSEKRITPETIACIRELKENGGIFVIVSARSPSGIYPILNRHDFTCPIISYSGGLILDEHRHMLYQNGMNRTDAGQVLDYIEKEKLDLTWCMYADDDWIVKDRSDPKILREEAIVEAVSREGDISSIGCDALVHKILCICQQESLAATEQKLHSAFPCLSIAKSSDILLEVMNHGVNKAFAVRFLCSYFQLDPKNAIAFGDHYNDVQMLQTVGHGYLMKNAPRELRNGYKLVTETDNDHDGIAFTLRGHRQH